MKVIEKVITYNDYNYVEGTLQFKAYGRKTRDLTHAEYFSIDRISHVHLEVEKKFLTPDLPPGINKNKVSSLSLPDKISTIVDGDYSKPYSIKYDEIIVDDDYVDAQQNIKGPRFNSTKIGSDLSSTIAIKVYGLIKIERTRVETENQFEITTVVYGQGKIELHPEKESYAVGEKISVKAVPYEKRIFLGFRNEFIKYPKDFEIVVEDKDITIEADFIDVQKAKEILESSKVGENLNFNRESLQTDYRKINSEVHPTFNDKIKNVWDRPKLKNERLGINANGFWEVLGTIISGLFYVFILIILISIFGKVFFIFTGIGLLLWLLNFISSYIFSWNVFRWFFGLFVGIMLFSGAVSFIRGFQNPRPYKIEERPIYETEKIVTENTTVNYRHHLTWQDYEGELYETDLIINSDLVENASAFKNSQPKITSEQSYQNLLNNLYRKSIKDDYYLVLKNLDSLRIARSLGRKKFAEVIVSMVQTIPYYAILEESCNPFNYQDPAIRELLLKSPCEPNIRHGIKAPAEFLKNLKGDCDTRTLFLYGLLKSFGYDTVIFGSQKYRHSILGITEIGEGPHAKIFNEKKYYMWEVTGTDFYPGQLPTEISNLNYWNINLY